MTEKRYLTIKEAAEYLGVTPLTLRNWDKKGKLSPTRHPMNNYRVYDKKDLDLLYEKMADKNAPRPETKKIIPRNKVFRLQVKHLRDD